MKGVIPPWTYIIVLQSGLECTSLYHPESVVFAVQTLVNEVRLFINISLEYIDPSFIVCLVVFMCFLSTVLKINFEKLQRPM